MKYNKLNIIGDIHGRPCWKELVQDDAINIFLGDYLDSREVVFAQNELVNFLEILHYKKENSENVVLLIANHDIKYMFGHDNPHYYNMFYEFRNLFDGIAYAHGDFLITHAGVSKEWYQRYFGEYKGESATELAEKINQLFYTDHKAFSFRANQYFVTDFCGEDPYQSPVWVRPKTLIDSNLLKDTNIIQVIGHTPVTEIVDMGKLILVDCLGKKIDSYIINI
jgi:hypothetical protein